MFLNKNTDFFFFIVFSHPSFHRRESRKDWQPERKVMNTGCGPRTWWRRESRLKILMSPVGHRNACSGSLLTFVYFFPLTRSLHPTGHAWDPFYFNLTCVMDWKIQSCGERKCKESERVGENTEGLFSRSQWHGAAALKTDTMTITLTNIGEFRI